MHYLKQYGLRRTGTNYIEVLIKKNFIDVEVLTNAFRWKHDTPKKITQEGVLSNISDKSFKYIISIKNPYSWVNSYLNYVIKNGENLKDKEIIYTEKGDINYLLTIEKIVGDWNSYTRKCLDFVHENTDDALLVKYEHLLESYGKQLELIKNKFKLEKKSSTYEDEKQIIGPGQLIVQRAFEKNYYKEERYLIELGKENVDIINDCIDRDVMRKLGYEVLVINFLLSRKS